VPAWAVCGPIDDWIEEKAASDSYPVKAGGMLASGVHRIVESPYELLYHTYDGTVNNFENGLGFFKGLGTGVWQLVENVGRGAIDIVGALVPGFHAPAGGHDHKLGGGSE
jgi:hypothetical protein